MKVNRKEKNSGSQKFSLKKKRNDGNDDVQVTQKANTIGPVTKV